MPRPRRCRRIGLPPEITYFKPAGIRMIELEERVLTLDEFEAIKLKDFQKKEQEEAAKMMNISQPTFHRLISSAREKIADVIINGKAMRIEGGIVEFSHQFRTGRREGGEVKLNENRNRFR